MHTYFLGICGSAMGNAAIMLQSAGQPVSGADENIYPPMSDQLRGAGIEIFAGWDVERLRKLAPDRVVVGNAMSRGNPELEWLLESRAIEMVSLPELLGREAIGRRPSVVISGTHGKTTTSALSAYLLKRLGRQPGWMIGGVPLNLPGGAQFGEAGEPFVIEGDEYDSAFFDKRSKFVHYRPKFLVINNLEFDHGDIFRDLADIQRSFQHVIRLVPRSGAILYNGDDPNLAPLLPVSWSQCFSVGTGANCDLRIERFAERAGAASFTLRWRGAVWGRVEWNQASLYNARNAAMALLAAGLAHKPEDPFCAIEPGLLRDFRGVKRRQERLLETEQLVVIEDFGHHPTAVADTLDSLRRAYPGHRLTACFEPRSNTACTKIFQAAFTDALARADACYLGPVHRAEKYADDERLDTSAMAAELKQRGPCSGAFASCEALLEELIHATQTKTDRSRCVIFFSNGSFGGIIKRYAEEAAKSR